MLRLGARVQSLRIKHLHEILQTRHVHLVLNRGRNRYQNLHEQPSQSVLNIFVLDLQEILSALLHELEGRFELLDRDHFDPEKLHAHQKTDDALRGVRRRVFGSQLLQFRHEHGSHGHKARLGQDPDDFRVQIRDYVHVNSVGVRLDPKYNHKNVLVTFKNVHLTEIVPFSVFEVFKRDVLDVLDEGFVAGVVGELLQDFDQDQAKDELDGQVAAFLQNVGLAHFNGVWGASGDDVDEALCFRVGLFLLGAGDFGHLALVPGEERS